MRHKSEGQYPVYLSFLHTHVQHNQFCTITDLNCKPNRTTMNEPRRAPTSPTKRAHELKMMAKMLMMMIGLNAFLQRLIDNISPARRRQIKAQQLRADFYNGKLLKRTRGGRGVVEDRSCPGNIPSSDSFPDKHEPITSTDVAIVVLILFFAGLWIVGW